MFFAFVLLLALTGALGFLLWTAWRRLSVHLRENPEAAKLIAEHVLAPVLFGKVKAAEKREPEKSEEGHAS
jgi:hypothetical protein